MKYIKTNEEFKFWDAIKNKVKGLFDNIDQKIADKISGKSVEMTKQKTKDGKAKVFSDIIEFIQTDYKTDMENSKNVISIRKTMKGTLTNLYATLTSIANSGGIKTLLPSQIFSKQFTFMSKIDPKNFDTSIDDSINRYLSKLDFSDTDKELMAKNKSIDSEVESENSEELDGIKSEIDDYIEKIINWVIKSGNIIIRGDGMSQSNDTLTKFTNQMGSKNAKSEEKLLKYVTNIKDPKQLASVRDILVQKGVIPKEEAGNMKF